MGIYQKLAEQGARTPDKAVLIEAGPSESVTYTYRELLVRAEQYSAGLLHDGVAPGQRVLMLMKPDFDWLAICFALFRIEAIPVFIDPGVGLRRLLVCIRRANARHLVAESSVYLFRLLARRAFEGVDGVFTRTSLGPARTRSLAQLRDASRGVPVPAKEKSGDVDAVCLIAFTSGSTGTPKGVEWTRRNLMSQLQSFHATFDTSERDTSLCTLPFFAAVGAAIGNTCVLPRMDFGAPATADPGHLLDVIERHGVTYGFASPALWSNVVAHCEARHRSCAGLRVAITGGAAVKPRLVQALQSVMRSGRVALTYGATEALLISSLSGREFLEASDPERHAPGRGVCVGRPVAGTRVEILCGDGRSATPNTLPPEHIGEVIVCGPVVSPRYHAAPEANRSAKLSRGEARDQWHRTGDAGFIDRSGALWLCGRLAHQTRAAGRIFHSLCSESVFATDPRVTRSCLVNCPAGQLPRTSPGDAEANETMLGLVVEGRDVSRARRAPLVSDLFDLADKHCIPITFIVFLEGRFPVDRRHNAKVDRGAVARWASRHKQARYYRAGRPKLDQAPHARELGAT